MTLTLDLHPIFRSDRDVDRAVRSVISKAARTGVEMVVRLYRGIEPDPENSGRVRVRFR